MNTNKRLCINSASLVLRGEFTRMFTAENERK